MLLSMPHRLGLSRNFLSAKRTPSLLARTSFDLSSVARHQGVTSRSPRQRMKALRRRNPNPSRNPSLQQRRRRRSLNQSKRASHNRRKSQQPANQSPRKKWRRRIHLLSSPACRARLRPREAATSAVYVEVTSCPGRRTDSPCRSR